MTVGVRVRDVAKGGRRPMGQPRWIVQIIIRVPVKYVERVADCVVIGLPCVLQAVRAWEQKHLRGAVISLFTFVAV